MAALPILLFFKYLRTAELFDRNVLVHVFGTDLGVIQDVSQSDDNHPETGQVTETVCNGALDQRQNTTAAYHHHENAGRGGRIFTQPLDGQVENITPHHRGAQPAKDHQHDTDRHFSQTE